jgi:DNA polymerase elongation subunit (family B)
MEIRKKQELKDVDEKIIFQVLDWDFFHDEDDEGNKQFAIRLFGKDKQQNSIYIQVDDFKPYFYVELQDNWRATTVDTILNEVKKKVKADHVDGLIKFNIEEKYKFWGFTNYKKFKFAKFTFNDFDSMKSYARAFTKAYKIYAISKRWLKFTLYESNILPVLRFMHIRNLEAVGWISIDKSKLEHFMVPPTCNQINYKTKFQNITRVEDRLIEKFTIASFDIECTSEDGSFPQPNRPGDKVIQIGITLSRFGEQECYERHLLGLHSTANITGAYVQWFETEEDLLLGFTKIIRKLNPDIMTGYNIFGFDFNYLMERAKFLDIEIKFNRLSRVTNENCQWIDQQLASSALGTNIMRYYKMTGRVIIDLMKVVQRDHKLSSYKLDYVASYFIREKALNFDIDEKKKKITIKTKKTAGLAVGNFVTITYAEGPVESKYMVDGDPVKFKVAELGNEYIVLEGTINTSEFLNKGYDVFWCQAKDDITPNDIFRLFKGSAEDRAIVGKYCIMDCELCNKLLDRLQIVTNNVSMANVCHVPLSYLFLRGQGVKIFSLVSKKCREREHLIPVIQKKEKKSDKKPWEEKDPEKLRQIKMDKMMDNFIYALNNKNKEDEEVDDDDDVGYEGAIVFPPKPDVYFEPVPVLDYASLYPNAMILRNLSHECFVNDPQYDNLPGYRYHTISYKIINREYEDMTEKQKELAKAKSKAKALSLGEKEKEPPMVTCRFAEKLDGTKGIIPEILMDLLSARKKFKKLMEAEKDPFTKGILDSLQLAYKVTANSLYGQTGASTSPICMKEIAASTTATGREMLQFSKYFIEFVYSNIINLALDKTTSFDDEYIKKMYEIFNLYPTEVTYKDTNRATGEVSDCSLHVCTDHNKPLPDSKFVKRFVGYEVDVIFDKDFNEYFDSMKKKNMEVYEKLYTNVMEKGKPTGEITFGNTLGDQLFALKVVERDIFYKDIKKYIVDKKGTTKTLFEKYQPLWTALEMKNESVLKKSFLKQLQDFDSDLKNTFLKNLEILVDETGYNGKEELFIKFHGFVNKVLKGYHVKQEVIYGDSVTADTPLLLRNKTTGKTIIKTIESLSNTWEKYDGFKTNDSNKYFLDIVKTLLKPDVPLANKRVDHSDDTDYLTEWMGGKYTECVSIKMNEELGLIETKYRYVQDRKTKNKYLEVKVGNVIMYCDPEDIDIVESNYFCFEEGYILTDKDRFHRMVLQKLTNRLPKKIQLLFENYTVDHINRNKIDNRKCNLRYILQNDQSRNCKISKNNLLSVAGVEEIKKDYKTRTVKLVESINKAIVEDNKDRFNKEQSKTEYQIWSGKKWTNIRRVIRHKTNKKIYRVITKTSMIDVTEDHSLIDEFGNYVRPDDCVPTVGLMQSYPTIIDTTFINNGFKKNKFISKDKEKCAKYYAYSNSKGFNVLIDYSKKHGIFTLIRTKETIKDSNKIVSISELKKVTTDEYVYDLETKNGKFHAGVGELIVKNTDSVFFCPHFTDDGTKVRIKDKRSLIMGIRIGIWAGTLIDTLLPAPMSQIYEKVLYPLILQGKKRYVGNLYEKDPEHYKQKSMGIEIKRRDNAPIVKLILTGIIEEILNNHSAEGAYEFARTTLHKIITGKFSFDKFVITKTLKGNSLTKAERKIEAMKPKEQRSYANRAGIVHAVLADRMADRDPGSKPISNDRIPYMYVEPKGKIKLQGERVETPEYIKTNKLKIDYLFYITNQIKKPALKFLDLILQNAESLFKEFEIKETNRKNCTMPISFYYDREPTVDEEEYNRGTDLDQEPENEDSYSSNDEVPKKKKTTSKLVNFDDLMETKQDSDDEAPKKKTKNKKVVAETKKSKKEIFSNLTCGDLIDGLNENDYQESSKKKTQKKVEKKKSSDIKELPTKSKMVTSYELISEFD